MGKILILAACAFLVWWLTRPKQPRKLNRPGKAGDSLVHCQHCGVYHEAQKPCQCREKA